MLRFGRKMQHFHLYLCFMGALVMKLPGARSQDKIIEPPVNTAQLEGQPVQLNCTVDRLVEEQLEWYEYVSSKSSKRIYSTALPDKLDSNLYEIVGQYNLRIKRVTMAMAGRYECKLYVSEKVAAAELTVLSAAQCTPPYDPPETRIEGATATLSCSTRFNTTNTPTFVPSMQWRRPTGSITTRNESVEGTAVFVSEFNATATDDNVEFTCDLSFKKPDGVTKEPPTYTDTCRSRFYVNHKPKNVRIYPDPSNWPDGQYMQLYVGNEINCTASARPPPRYFWRRLAGEGQEAIVQGDTLRVEQAHTRALNKYACVAQAQDSSFEASKEVEFTAISVVGAGERLFIPVKMIVILSFLFLSTLES